MPSLSFGELFRSITFNDKLNVPFQYCAVTVTWMGMKRRCNPWLNCHFDNGHLFSYQHR